MIILVDSREQIKLKFPYQYVEEVRVGKLHVGDYACVLLKDHIPKVIFEKKSIGDLFSTFGKEYKRFKREIIRAQEGKITLIILIIGTLSKILKGTRYSQLEGKSIVKKLFTLQTRHGVPFVCCKDEEEAARYIYEQFCSIGREYLRGKKNVPNHHKRHTTSIKGG